MNCVKPVDDGALADYWLGALPGSEEEAIEEHLLACDECGARLRETIALGEAVRELARGGSLLMVVSEAFLRSVSEQGLRVREYAPPNGGDIACTVTEEDDFLIGRLTADLSAVRRVDVSLCDERGVEKLRMADVPFNPRAGSIAFQQSITYAKAAASETIIARLVGFHEKEGERLLGEYTFRHTRTLAGPGGTKE